MPAADMEEDECELFNDDGFVYKRKKRPALDPAAAPPPPDPAAEENYRRKRRKRALAKLREKYQKEICQWEILSNTLRELQCRAQNQQWQQQMMTMARDLAVDSTQPLEHLAQSDGRKLLDDLILRAEAEEVTLQDASDICDVAEVVCNVQANNMKQSFVDLPIWASPRELMASLCDD